MNSVEVSVFDITTTAYFLARKGGCDTIDGTVTIKRGDTRHAIQAILKDVGGNPVNLTGCETSFVIAPRLKPAIINRAAHVESAEAGEVWIVWEPGDTDVSGMYRAEIKVIYPDGRRETFPNNGYISIHIINDLR